MCRVIRVLSGTLQIVRWLALVAVIVVPSVTAQTKPSFTVTAPNILCSNDVQLHHQTYFTIRLEPTGGQRLNYRININYERSVPNRSQEHSLRLWRTVRGLEEQLNRQRTLINTENKIDIATAVLTPGVIYIFNIEAEDENGVVSDKERFVLEYKDGKLYRMCKNDAELFNETIQNLTEDPLDRPWIRLKGPKYVYANLPVILSSKVNFIGSPNEFYVKWTMNDTTSLKEKILSSKGLSLTIPPFQLRPGTHYHITADLIDAASSTPIARSSISIFVRFHELKAFMVPSGISTGINRVVNFDVKVFDRNVHRPRFMVEWRCMSLPNGELCKNFNPDSSTSVSVNFSQPGDYQLTAIVTNQDNLTVTRVGSVTIDRYIIPQLSITEYPDQPVDVTKWIKALAKMDFVVAGCRAKWGIVKEEGFEFNDLKNLTNGIGEIIVHDFESFLSDLANFSNITVSKHVKLRVPPAYTYPDWNGLTPDKRFKFRLNVDCPATVDSNNKVTDNQLDRVFSYIDIEMESNSPPSDSSLSIVPETGLALMTQFTFMATPASDSDKPVIYSHGITFNNTNLVLGRGNGLLNFAHILPFDKEIQPYTEACDTYGACTKIFGPAVVTRLPDNLTLEFIRDELDYLESAMDRMEYNSTFNRIVIFGVTLRQVTDHQLYNELISNIIKIIRGENRKNLEVRKSGSMEFSDEEVLSYVRGVKLLMELFDIRDKEIIVTSVELIETILVKLDQTEPRDIKRKRDLVDQTNISTDTRIPDNDYRVIVQEALEMLDKLHPNDTTVFEQAKNVSRLICYTAIGQEENFQTIRLRTFKQNHDYKNFTTFNFPTSHQDGVWRATAQLGNYYKVDFGANDYCVSAFFDAKDQIPIYQWLVFERKRNNGGLNSFEVLNSTVGGVTNGTKLEIQINLNSTFQSSQLKCQMLINTTWSQEICVTSSKDTTLLVCNCTKNEPVSFVVEPIKVTKPIGGQIVAENPTFASLPPKTVTTISTNATVVTTVPITTTILSTAVSAAVTTTSTQSTAAPTTVSVATVKATSVIPGSTNAGVQPKPTTVVPSQTPMNNSNGVKPSVKPTESGVTVEEEVDSPSFVAAVSYTALAVVVIGVVLGGVFIYIYRSNSRGNNSFALDLQSIAAEARSQMPGVRYARFQDENIMRGDVYSVG